MPGKEIKIGPFAGGLNNISQSGESDDDQVVQLVNMEVANDKSLVSRPPMSVVVGSTLPSANTIGWDILGIYRVSSFEWYLVVSTPKDASTNTDFTVKMYRDGIVGVGEQVTVIKQIVGVVNRPTAMVQFRDEMYFLLKADATISCFKWKKGDITGGTNVADMKKGNVLISWKGRLWITGTDSYTTGDRIYFSNVGANGPEPSVWPATNFIDIAPGEGGFITSIVPSFNNLIVFKTDGTWRFSYPSAPANGQVDKINGSIGAASKNSVIEFENYIYVYDQGTLYELMNSSYTQINRFTEFREDPNSVDSDAPGVDLSIVDRRLVVRYYNALYVFGIETKTWSNWFSYAGTPGKFLELPTDTTSSISSTYIAPSRGLTQSTSQNLIQDPEARITDVKNGRTVVENGTSSIIGGRYVLSNISGSVFTEMHLNRTGNRTEYDLPVSVGQTMTLSAKCPVRQSGCGFRVAFYKKNGSVQTIDHIPAVEDFTTDIIVPADSILVKISAFVSSPGGEPLTIEFHDIVFSRKSAPSPFNLMTVQAFYEDTTLFKEFIDCWIETKSYDYQAPSSTKRMFYWGLDIITPRPIQAEARPVSRIRPVTWEQLDAFTWEELEQGTWGSPLSWQGSTQDIVDYTDATEDVSSNGRFFIKLKKNLRFRQISYFIRMSSLGTKMTGPAKLFSITTIVLPKQDVVDKVS